MLKKKIISLLEFLKTGMFGDVLNGAQISTLETSLGAPLYVKEDDDLTSKWVYEDVDFYINNEHQTIWGIMIWGFRAKDDLGNFPMANKMFRIDPWLLRWQSGIGQTHAALKSEGISFRHSLATPTRGYETCYLESGTTISFTEGSEAKDRKSEFVYDAIFNIDTKYAVTSKNQDYLR
jgi:hypothetical protein